MAQTIAYRPFEKLIKNEFPKIFGERGVVYRNAAEGLLGAILRTGSTLVKRLARSMDETATSLKGMQEKISRWLDRYDFASPISTYLWSEGLRYIQRDTFIAVDFTDLSKEFGGEGMEGMSKGLDASRDVIAMGHSILAATINHNRRAVPLHLELLKGRAHHTEEPFVLVDRIAEATGRKGILTFDRGFDSLRLIHHLYRQDQRSVIRIMEPRDRDLFGDGKTIEEAMKPVPQIYVHLHSPSRKIKAALRWRQGQIHVPATNEYIPVLVVESTLGDHTMYLYAIDFVGPHATPEQLRNSAILAANAYFNRWSVEVFFQDLKSQFAIEEARVRTFQRLRNLVALSLLAYNLFAHTLPQDSTTLKNVHKLLKDNFHDVMGGLRAFISSIRELLALAQPRNITGRPRKRSPSNSYQCLLALGI